MSKKTRRTTFNLSGIQKAVDLFADAVVVCDGAGRVACTNSASPEFLGREEEDLLGQQLEQFVPSILLAKGGRSFVDMVRAGGLDAQHELELRGGRKKIIWCSTNRLICDESELYFVIVSMRDVTGFARKSARLRRLALLDELTGLSNRRHLDRVMEVEQKRSVRYGYHLACALVDIDNLKTVNRKLGRKEGDEVIKIVGDVLHSCLRTIDSVGRFDEDTFLMLALIRQEADLAQILGRVTTMLERRVRNWNELGVLVTVSCGGAVGDCSTGVTAEMLVAQAGESLKKAKRAGRNHTRIAVVTV